MNLPLQINNIVKSQASNNSKIISNNSKKMNSSENRPREKVIARKKKTQAKQLLSIEETITEKEATMPEVGLVVAS